MFNKRMKKYTEIKKKKKKKGQNEIMKQFEWNYKGKKNEFFSIFKV